ncbi:unnamed protein product [marine sediment metagenome]|uniref:Uncharacterized protein n=1 Tax=marine sediment metagenome TaxID=412755 RepID=X1U8M4_9ZZZZ
MTVEEIKTELEKMVPSFAAKIAPVYQTLEWQWSPGKSTPHIPLVGEIENTLYSLIEGLTPSGYDEACTGGLSAYYRMPDDTDSGCYGLAFECNEEERFD